MESYGEKLVKARTEKNYSLEQVAQETHISKRFIEAMEVENSSIFPAETYLLGFLRNYSEYLGLDPEEVLTLYKNIKIQEQPIPMDELLHGKNNPVPVLLILLIIAGACILGLGSFITYKYFTEQPETQIAEIENTEQVITQVAVREAEDFIFNGGVLSQPFRVNDSVSIRLEDSIYRMTISAIEDKATITLPDKNIKLSLLDPYNIDINRDDISDIELVLTDIDTIDNEFRIIMRVSEIGTLAINIDQALFAMQEDQNLEDLTDLTEPTDVTEDIEETPVEIETPVSIDSGDRQVILNSSRAKTFTLNIDFTGNCFVRYSIDNNERVEHFYQKNDSPLVIDTARDSIKLWISNSGAIEADIEGTKISFGDQGQISTKQIQWVKNSETGDYELEIISVN